MQRTSYQRPLVSWDDVRFFLVASQASSFAAAAQILGTDKATVGRRMRSIEDRINQPLFVRGRHGSTLTETGQLLRAVAERMAEEARLFEHQLAEIGVEHDSVVRIATGELVALMLADHFVPERNDVAELGEVRIDCASSLGRQVDEQAHLTIVMCGTMDLPEASADCRIRKVARIKFRPVIGRSLLRGRDPASILDLNAFQLITHSEYREIRDFDPWSELLVQRRSGPLVELPSLSALARLVNDGIGVGLLPIALLPRWSDLVSLDHVLPAMQVDLYAVAHKGFLEMRRVRAALDMVLSMFDPQAIARRAAESRIGVSP